MIEDVYEPLKKYRDSFREKFSELTAQKFRELLEKSGIDFEANRKLVAEIKDLKNKSSDKSQKSTMLAFTCVLLIIVAVACDKSACYCNNYQQYAGKCEHRGLLRFIRRLVFQILDFRH